MNYSYLRIINPNVIVLINQLNANELGHHLVLFGGVIHAVRVASKSPNSKSFPVNPDGDFMSCGKFMD